MRSWRNPLNEVAQMATARKRELSHAMNATKILVLDDTPSSRLSLSGLLRKAGHQIFEASTGAEALAIARAEHPDIVISDVLMPSMDGYEFARRVRSDPSIANTPIIFHTAGYDQNEARSLAHSCGVFHILEKPAERGKLFRTVNEVLNESALPAAKVAPTENFDDKHRQLLTNKLSKKVAELEAALDDSRHKEIRLREMMVEAAKAERILAETNKDLLRRNEEIQSFYHTVSHELKTPLTSAREFISIVMDGLAGPLNEAQQEYLAIARQSCDRLRVCIDDLMDASRLETGKLTLEIKPGSLGAVIEQLTTLLAPVAAGKRITLTHEVEADLPEFCFDENRLMQVLVNLVNNALKFTPESGRVTITAGRTSEHPGCVEVAVSDTGCGLAPAEKERVFERLYQVPNSDAGSEQGLGLGLYICRELVQSHGGRIWVESELGKGSTFYFVIPLEQPVQQVHVLVVDDDARLRPLIARTLQKKGFRVTTAENGAAGLAKMNEELPDVVVTDLAMPKTDGPAMLRQIRQKWGLLPVIVLTGFAETDLMQRAMEFSPFTLLIKPCSPEQLIETIRSLQPAQETCRKSAYRETPHNSAYLNGTTNADDGNYLNNGSYPKPMHL
jgi:signal transduction histidine kinase